MFQPVSANSLEATRELSISSYNIHTHSEGRNTEMTTAIDAYHQIVPTKRLIYHLRTEHGHIDSTTEMAKWSRDELERAHIDAHKMEVK